MYYIYHIPGQKIGVTTNPKIRVEKIQGYKPSEYEILLETECINEASEKEILYQKEYRYRIDRTLYKNLTVNKMKLNITEQTTTFPVPRKSLNKLLQGNIGFSWQTKYGKVALDVPTASWIVNNSHNSQFSKDRCYVYNKALYEFFSDENSLESLQKYMEEQKLKEHINKVSEKVKQINVVDMEMVIPTSDLFPLIRQWARERKLYEKGDSKTQYVKLQEEAGELAKALLNNNRAEIDDAIGDVVVVLTNLAHLEGLTIEDCIRNAYNVISKRKGKMVNGTFIKEKL